LSLPRTQSAIIASGNAGKKILSMSCVIFVVHGYKNTRNKNEIS